MKRSFSKLLIAGAFSSLIVANGAYADSNEWKEQSLDAWIDGKAESVLLFNTHLSAFDINTDVEQGVVTLTGKVDRSVDKALAEELVESLQGVQDVNNHLVVVNKQQQQDSALINSWTDTKVATVVKTKLLLESEVSGSAINVEVEEGVVTLAGEVDSAAEKALAIKIAQNTNDVEDVVSKLAVTNS
ncbi:transport-associated protein [Catenovulum agarivorans DS-2]|uniref:Transport-associated protein n=1 Tax=Catenovulum agarivorans DS-2 TaxID=1328313 RepID=W7QZT4_9ALTE|nr:BON domain-containing protein [Catenovulum agarivorans]EWH10860.1 transport-associated protein [Catenovulum agarivorans DS-2]